MIESQAVAAIPVPSTNGWQPVQSDVWIFTEDSRRQIRRCAVWHVVLHPDQHLIEVERPLNTAETIELMGLLFLHGMALGSWFVPLSGILDQSWLSSIKPWAFAA